MKKFFPLFFIVFILFQFYSSAQQTSDTQAGFFVTPVFTVMPPDYTSTPGPGTFTGPLTNTARTYQLLINSSLLTSLVGKELLAISFRLPTSATATWPTSETIYNNYDVYLSGSVAPADRSLTFASNVVGTQVKVRYGSLTIPANAYPYGSTPNDFGPPILFNTPYLYNGGHLLIEIRHDGSAGTSRTNDAITTSTSGYGTLFSGCWGSGYTATTGSQGNFSIVRLTSDDPVPVELTSFTASTKNDNVILNWVTASETNNRGFEIERKTSNSAYTKIGFVNGNGSITELNSYSFTDSKLISGVYTYRLKQIDFDGTFSYSNEISAEVTTPYVYSLEQNYPNPFNPSTVINFGISEAGMVKISVHNLLGQKIAVLLNEYKNAGNYNVELNAAKLGLNSGTYFYSIETGKFRATKKMILMK